MVAGDEKRVVVLKNISSNIIEEAILILKNDPMSGQSGSRSGTDDEKQKRDNDLLFKEAEMIINNYVRDNNLHIVRKKRDRRLKSYFKNKSLTNITINITILCSIAFLIYIVMRLI